MRLTPRVPRGALALMFFFSSLFFFTNRGTDFARKEGLRLVHLERKSVISYQSFLSGTHTFVFSFSSFQCSVCHTLRSLKVFWNTFTMIFLRVVVQTNAISRSQMCATYREYRQGREFAGVCLKNFFFFFFFQFTRDMSVNICLLKRRSCCHSTKDFYQKVIMPFLHFSSKNKSLNCDDGGLLPDAYFHLVRKKAANQ